MNRMKSTKKCIIIGLIISLCIILYAVSMKCSSPISYDRGKVTDNAAAYIMISQVYLDDYKKHDSNTRYDYSKGYKKDDKCFIKCYTGEYIFSIEIETLTYSKAIEDTYYVDDQFWEYVRVNDNFVVFGNVNGRASIIYSANDKKPSFVDDPNNIDKHIYVEKIAGNLYFAAKR